MTGYAYSGGGQPIIRVDVSADAGATWTTAELKPIDARRYRCGLATVSLFLKANPSLARSHSSTCSCLVCHECLMGEV